MEVIENENLIENAKVIGDYLFEKLKDNRAISELRGKGLMIGMEIKPEFDGLRNRLLFEKHIFTGGAGKSVIRLLPPLCITKEIADHFIDAINDLAK